jgi:hypothetical protein
MPDDPDLERAQAILDAWRSGGAHDLARKLVSSPDRRAQARRCRGG